MEWMMTTTAESSPIDSDLAALITAYTTKPHKELNSLLLDRSKDALIAAFTKLLTLYFNDKNSSTLREFVTVTLAGYTFTGKKLGYNGFKQATTIGGKPIHCEAKPGNIDTEHIKTLKTRRRLNGGGSFNDYTPKRFEKDKRENPQILVSGFVDGRLICLLEFPFKCPGILATFKRQLEKHYGSSKTVGYLRGAGFNFKDYKDCKELKVVHLDKKGLRENKNSFTRGFYEFLASL